MAATPHSRRAEHAPQPELAAATYRVLFAAAADPILVADSDARYLDANDAACELLGYTREELRGMRVHDVVAPGPAWAEEQFGLFREDGSWRNEVDVRRRDGSTVTVEAHATRVDLPDGPIFVSVLRDQTERLLAARRERRRTERLRQLTDMMPVLIAFVDTQLRYRFINKAYERWFARPRSEMLGRRVDDQLGADGFAAIRPHVERALAGERVEYEAHVTYPDGATRYIAATYVPYVEEDGRVLGFYAMIGDLTERRRAEEALRLVADASAALMAAPDTDTMLRRLADLAVPAIADACIVDMLDAEGRPRRVAVASTDPRRASWVWDVGEAPFDPEAAYGPARVLRTGEPELVPELTDEHLARAARNPEHLAHLRRDRLVSHMIVPVRARGRTLGTISFVTSRSGRRYGPDDLALAEDLAQRAALAADNARLYAEAQAALQARDDALSGVSHDLRTPITSIKGRAQLLLRRARRGESLSPETVASTLAAINGVADRMGVLVDELVDSGRLESGRPLELNVQPVDLVALARDAVAEAQRTTSRHELRLESAEPSLAGEWDAARLERVLANLLSNAIKYSPEGGAVVVAVAREGDAARVDVRDAGLGIPAADLPHVFERFRRGGNVAGRIAGTGIGLAGARQIVEQHGGTIDVQSAEGRGSTFTVRLPLE